MVLLVGLVILGAIRPLDDVINFSDAANGLMALPNLIALIVLSPVIVRLTNEYIHKQRGKKS